MPATDLKRRFDRSKIAPLKAERSEGSYGHEKPELVERQVLPENNFVPSDQISSDEDSGSEDEGADNSSDEEEDLNNPNPFEPMTSTASRDQTSISTSTTTHKHPFPTRSLTSSSATSTYVSAYPPTSTETGTTPSQGHLSTSSTFPGSFTTSSPPTTVVPLATSVSTSPIAASEGVSASNHPIAKAAIIVPSLLGAVAAVVAAYLLFRYCTSLKTRWAVYRARRGQRLPGEEEDGPAPQVAPPMSESYTTRTTELTLPPPLYTASTATPPTPSVAGDPDIAVPVTTRRAPPPLLVRTGSKSTTPANAAVADQHTRSHSGTRSLHNDTTLPPAYTLGGHGTHTFQVHVEEDTGARNGEEAPFRHPNGLANNPPTPVARKHPLTPSIRGHEPTSPVPSMPSPTCLSVGSRLSMDFPMPPTAPSAAHFSTPSSPPGSTFSPPRRLRKSITPSESISNVPDSPFPFSPALRPPMPPPAWTSRWSHNSSSIHGRIATVLAEERCPAPLRHSAGPGLVDTRLSPLRSPAPKKISSYSLVAPPS
ncbi:hypothetical protein AYL99_05266 [Fonsecaea erecta]|uniref:Uncharacterized protein n=1 Tax=Fonsecaea erecta TaxID=1367422 RepID=A0A178ZKE5_9EURO|nr:hypothetical protein AYL99_05266 [Fonsecaea erecta]OAP60264.1 hypothetical protein AYL99_05266 [Fonsecaea erecta]